MNIKEAILKYKKSGEHKHFFDKETMKFWNSNIETNLIDDKYFITSEDNFNREKRLYTIREFKDDYSDVSNICGFQSFDNIEDAKYGLLEYIKRRDASEK